jgi:hypothetical protein
MRTHPNDRSFKPRLETLEPREMPAAGLLGAVQALQTDLNTANGDFSANFATLASQGAGSTATAGQFGTTLANTTANWQRVLSDQAAIQSTATADINFLNLASFVFASQTHNSNVFFATVFFVDPQFQNIINSVNTAVNNSSASANANINVTNPAVSAVFGTTVAPISSYTSTTT